MCGASLAPFPVVKTKKAMEEYPDETLIVLVESAVSRENVLHPPGK